VIPKGPIASGLVTKEEFGRYKNLEFDDSNILESEYAGYIDSFDYLIILYEPSINASGKVLDAITRGVPVAVPREATEWSEIASNWGESHHFHWTSAADEGLLFQHPKFENPKFSGEPPFTPRNALKTIVQLSSEIESTLAYKNWFRRQFVQGIAVIYFTICTMLNLQYAARVKVKSFLRANSSRKGK
jgi:hypothetical protein